MKLFNEGNGAPRRRWRSDATRQRWIHRYLSALRRVRPGEPWPLPFWSGARSLLGALFEGGELLRPASSGPPRGATVERIAALGLPFGIEELGGWALDADTVLVVREILDRWKPRTIVECGAGRSTLFLAAWASEQAAARDVLIVSLEQDEKVLADLSRRLREIGLDQHSRLIHSPTTDQGVYTVRPGELEEMLAGRKAELLLIDGPFGPAGCRRFTLPMLVSYAAESCCWLLDDAFRDGELRALREWAAMTAVKVEGIFPVGKGLAVGSVRGRMTPAQLEA